ncbi:MAG: hypothetical protein HYU05_02070 [Candidatus Wildermuthbacteria bacterium]|nr:hypothetical protein [Candidatus Wildermuthbacteria bacterium]
MDAKKLGKVIEEVNELDLADALMGLSPYDFGKVLSLIHQRDDEFLSLVAEEMEGSAREAFFPELNLEVMLAQITPANLKNLLEGIDYGRLSSEQLADVLTVLLEGASEKEGTFAEALKSVSDQTFSDMLEGMTAQYLKGGDLTEGEAGLAKYLVRPTESLSERDLERVLAWAIGIMDQEDQLVLISMILKPAE